MKRLLLIFLILSCNLANAFEIVYPKTDNVTINSDKTFFIGNEKEGFLKINDNEVKIHKSGGFKQPVNLEVGENIFVIDNGKTKKIYKITRQEKIPYNEPQIVDYELPVTLKTVTDNSPLRSTPVDKGLNRLSHLNLNTELEAVGEFGNFYKVKLARDDFGWIAKSNVNVIDDDYIPSVIINQDYKNTDNAQIFTFKTDGKKIPYVLSETKKGFDLFLYGLNDNIFPYGKYEFSVAQNGKNFGYFAKYENDDELNIKINKFTPEMKNLKITIDPGHGGKEYGAIGCLGDKEKDVNLKIALKLREKLQQAGAQVFMTRTSDVDLSLQERVDFTNKNDSNIFISIHNNAVADASADKEITGSEVYYFYPQAKELARAISDGINQKTGLKNNGIKGESFAVIRNSQAVSVLVECAYMIEPEDNFKLQDEDFLDKIAQGILLGLENYLK